MKNENRPDMMRGQKDSPKDMLGRARIMSLAEALELLQANLPSPVRDKEEIALAEALGRITAREIRSPEDLPPHPRSTVDGYAVRARDTFGASESMPAYLEVSGEVRMGEYPARGPRPGSCYIIPTGGLLPPSTDAVVMLEHTVTVDSRLIEVTRPAAAGANILGVGEDIARGDPLFGAGHRLRPQELGLLAGLGIGSLHVCRKARVGILATGDEIVGYRESPPPGKIRDINSVHLAALVAKHGGSPQSYGIAADSEEEFTALIRQALAENDMVLFSGSSSVGTRDLGERVIAGLGPPGIIFHGVAIRPGKPVIYGLAGGRPLFGLPGHPVSAAVCFDLFVRPVLSHLAGLEADGFQTSGRVKARLMRNFSSAAGRTDFVRVQLRRNDDSTEFEAHPVLGKSGALSTMVRADGYIVVAERLQGLREGESVEVVLYE